MRRRFGNLAINIINETKNWYELLKISDFINSYIYLDRVKKIHTTYIIYESSYIINTIIEQRLKHVTNFPFSFVYFIHLPYLLTLNYASHIRQEVFLSKISNKTVMKIRYGSTIRYGSIEEYVSTPIYKLSRVQLFMYSVLHQVNMLKITRE